MNKTTLFYLIFLLIPQINPQITIKTANSTLLNGFSLTDFVKNFGYPIEIHKNIQTEDGYLLTMHRIPTNLTIKSKKPIFLMHGLQGSAPNFVIMGPGKSLAFLLANKGYDVWLGNARGTVYSQKHKLFNTKQKEYWDFSWHEIGLYDLPAMLNYIKKKTNAEQINYIGHSQGTTVFFVMASMLPKYNKFIKLMIALAPGAYYQPKSTQLQPYLLNSLVESRRNLININDIIQIAKKYACKPQVGAVFTQSCDLFTQNLVNGLGFNIKSLNTSQRIFFEQTYPDSASTKQFLHYIQLLLTGEFAQYDYGPVKNTKIYGNLQPPKYELTHITANIALLMAEKDFFGSPKNCKRLIDVLPNVVMKYVVPDENFTHFDYLLGEKVGELVYGKIFELLSEIN